MYAQNILTPSRILASIVNLGRKKLNYIIPWEETSFGASLFSKKKPENDIGEYQNIPFSQHTVFFGERAEGELAMWQNGILKNLTPHSQMAGCWSEPFSAKQI